MQPSRRQLLRMAASLAGMRFLLRGEQDTPTFSTGVNVVNVLATVTDRREPSSATWPKTISCLNEDHRPQTLRYFSRESDLPSPWD